MDVVLESGQILHNVHDEAVCAGRSCCIHNPSDHPMRDFPRYWRFDRRIMERTCPHDIGHPDPDDPVADPIHSCDGCCS